MVKSTIYALSSGSGRAGIAVLRISGPKAKLVLESVAGTAPAPRLASLRTLRAAGSREVIDQGLVIWFPSPNSATGEDVAEFHVHGSTAIIARLFSEFALHDDVVIAEAGEFTKRAFENGILDLVEVEGLADLLSSNSETQRRMAMRQFLGEASSIFENWRKQLISSLAYIEASIDFVEEQGVASTAVAHVLPSIQILKKQLEDAVSLAGRAAAVRDGLRLVIAGPPNVGKSSLLNWLAGRDAAIVSNLAGTTRDVVESAINFSGVTVFLADTAGLRRKTDDEIESIGMARTSSEMNDADLLVWVISPEVIEEVGPSKKPDVIVLNKSDLLHSNSIHLRNDVDLKVSILSGEGLPRLRIRLEQLVAERSALTEHAFVVRDRHVTAVRNTIRILNNIEKQPDRPLELLAEELRYACRLMGTITGRVDVEDLLGRIFSEFCIGK